MTCFPNNHSEGATVFGGGSTFQPLHPVATTREGTANKQLGKTRGKTVCLRHEIRDTRN